MDEQKPRRRRTSQEVNEIPQENKEAEVENLPRAKENRPIQLTQQKPPAANKKPKKNKSNPFLIAATIIEGLIIALLLLSIMMFSLNGWTDRGFFGFANGIIATPTPMPVLTPTPTLQIEYIFITPQPTYTPTPTPVPTPIPTPVIEYIYITPVPTFTPTPTPIPTAIPTPIVEYVYITPSPTPVADYSAPAVYEKYVKDRVLTESENSNADRGKDRISGILEDLSEASDTQLYFNYACNMKGNGDDIVRVEGKLIYGGIVWEDIYMGLGIEIDKEFVEYWNGKIILGQDVLYKTMSKAVEQLLAKGASAYRAFDEERFEIIFGTEKPQSYKNGEKYFKKVSSLLKSKDGSKGIFESFSNAKTIKGYLDFESRNCNFTIPNVQETAKELGISERMLGYTLAVFDAYGAEIKFNGYTCTIKREL